MSERPDLVLTLSRLAFSKAIVLRLLCCGALRYKRASSHAELCCLLLSASTMSAAKGAPATARTKIHAAKGASGNGIVTVM